MPSFIDLLQRKLSRIGDPVLQKMIATGLVGGLSGLFTAYLNRQLGATRQAIHRLLRQLAVQHGSAVCPCPRSGPRISSRAMPRSNLMLLGFTDILTATNRHR